MTKSIQIIVVIVALALLIIAILKFGGCPGCNVPDTGVATSTSDLIRVTTPLPNAVIESPLTISGEARGNWYFEASFPIRLFDSEGVELAVAVAQAQGEWMTTEFVPFETNLIFISPAGGQTGTLVLQKDNASGLPEHDAELRIPVRFDGNTSQTRIIKLFYYNEDKDKDASGNIICSERGLESVERQIPLSISPIQDAIKLLLEGDLTFGEQSRGIGTEFPLSGLELKSTSLVNGALTLTFADPQNKTTGGSCRVNVLRAQIEATAKQFDVVTSVRILPEELFQP
jgi:hypothetical protein